jgi:hypothetical protein
MESGQSMKKLFPPNPETGIDTVVAWTARPILYQQYNAFD